jgi:hypothetical protein
VSGEFAAVPVGGCAILCKPVSQLDWLYDPVAGSAILESLISGLILLSGFELRRCAFSC